MARRKGSKDKKPRKQQAKVLQTPAAPPGGEKSAPSSMGRPSPAPPAERSRLDDSEFRAAIAAELDQAQTVTPAQGNADSASCSPPVPAADFDPASLTIDGLANAWRLPFYALARLLAWLRVAPDPEPIEAVGRRHAKVMAKASWPIWDYYARQYVNVHPDQGVNVAIGVTVLDGIGIVPDLIDAVGESRRRAARAAAAAAAAVPPPPVQAGGTPA